MSLKLRHYDASRKQTSDKRFMGSVWKVTNQEWFVLSACGTLGGVVIIWKSNKFSCSNMVLRSFSVIIKLIADEEETFWLTSIYGPNKSNLRKDFWVNLQDLFGLPFSNWGGGEREGEGGISMS